jgi:hypothetical protein
MRKSRGLPIPLNGVDRTDPGLRSKFRSVYGRAATGIGDTQRELGKSTDGLLHRVRRGNQGTTGRIARTRSSPS